MKLYEISPTIGYGVYQVYVIANSKEEAIEMARKAHTYLVGMNVDVAEYDLVPGYVTCALE